MSLSGIAASIKIVRLPGLPEKGDAYDWIEQGGTREELDALIQEASDVDYSERKKKVSTTKSFTLDDAARHTRDFINRLLKDEVKQGEKAPTGSLLTQTICRKRERGDTMEV